MKPMTSQFVPALAGTIIAGTGPGLATIRSAKMEQFS